MNKIKRQYVEDLFNACKDWGEEYDKSHGMTESTTKKWNVVIEKKKALQGIMDPEGSDGFTYAKYCLVSDFTEAIVFAKMSLSRLLKCLEVCGIEVVE